MVDPRAVATTVTSMVRLVYFHDRPYRFWAGVLIAGVIFAVAAAIVGAVHPRTVAENVTPGPAAAARLLADWGSMVGLTDPAAIIAAAETIKSDTQNGCRPLEEGPCASIVEDAQAITDLLADHSETLEPPADPVWRQFVTLRSQMGRAVNQLVATQGT